VRRLVQRFAARNFLLLFGHRRAQYDTSRVAIVTVLTAQRVHALSEVSLDTSTASCSLCSTKRGVLIVGVTGHADLHDQSNNLQNAASCTLCVPKSGGA